MKTRRVTCSATGRWAIFAVTLAVAAAQTQAQPVSETTSSKKFTIGSWAIVPVDLGKDTVGIFLWRRVTVGSGEYVAFYFERGEAEWSRWIYPGDDLGAAVIEAENLFNIDGLLTSDPLLGLKAKQRVASGEPLPSTTYMPAINALVSTVSAAGLVGTDEDFPGPFIGTDAAADFGILQSYDIEIDQCDFPIFLGGDLLTLWLDEIVLELDGLLEFEDVVQPDGTIEKVATNSPLALLGFKKGKICGPWSLWGPWSAWTVQSDPVGGGYVCVYRSNRTRTRSCRSMYRFCGIQYWSTNYTETETDSDSVTCWNGNALCPAIPPGGNPPPPGCI